MPSYCCVVGCKNNRFRDKVKLYRIPAILNFVHKTRLNELSKLRREKWLSAINRADLTEKKLRNFVVCSKHFITGKPACLEDVLNPDWVPSIDMGSTYRRKKSSDVDILRCSTSKTSVELQVIEKILTSFSNMNQTSDNGKEVIKVIIVDEDGTENEVDSKALDFLKVEISNSDNESNYAKDEASDNDDISQEDALLLENIKVEVIEDPVEEFGEYILSQNLEEYSDQEYFHQYIQDEDESHTRKRNRDGSSFESIKKRNHVCDICGYSSYQKSHYRRHLAIHSKPDGIRCSICRQEMEGKAELTEHMEVHRCSFDRDRFQCNLCSYSSKKLTNVSQHTEIHYKPEKIKFECENCDFSTTNQTLYRKHIRMHGNSRRSTRCPVCLVVFKSMAARRSHLQKYKNGPDPNKYQCPECSYRTAKFNNFKQHMVVHRNEYEIEMFQCPYCPFKSKRKTDLRQHVIVKHKTDEEVLLFGCDFCSYESRRGNHLTSHMKNRHSREIVMKKCGLCSYKTVSQVLIEKHCNIHSKVPEHFFLCSICGSGFLSMKLLKGHIEKTHSDEHEFFDSSDEFPIKEELESECIEDIGYSVELCKVNREDGGSSDEEMETLYCCQFPQCQFQSTIERDAKIHKTICHNKRGDDNRCPECTFHTTSRYLYLDHLKVHKINIEHLKPHLCDICGTRWIRQGDLTRHMAVHWGNDSEKRRRSSVKQENVTSDKKLLECNVCPYTTRLRLCLYKHMLKHGKEHQMNFNSLVEEEEEEFSGDVMYVTDEVDEDDAEFFDNAIQSYENGYI